MFSSSLSHLQLSSRMIDMFPLDPAVLRHDAANLTIMRTKREQHVRVFCYRLPDSYEQRLTGGTLIVQRPHVMQGGNNALLIMNVYDEAEYSCHKTAYARRHNLAALAG
jgi:hypothetical protein